MKAIFIYLFVLIKMSIASEEEVYTTAPDGNLCRDRSGFWEPEIFRLRACSSCYAYLFHTHDLRSNEHWLVAVNSTIYSHMTFLVPDIHNVTSKNAVCRTLQSEECSRWVTCCLAAERCCARQRDMVPWHRQNMSHMMCPRTWDGYACWDDTPAGSLVRQACPEFIQYALPRSNSVKTCTENATWYIYPLSHMEWTNFTGCSNNNFETFRLTIFLNVACNAASLFLLVPAVFIFIYYRPLRIQHRIRLHINLFFSFIFTNTVFILWDILIAYDRLTSSSAESRMHSNSDGCKMLYVLTRYTRSANFLWMLSEAYYLHRLIAKAFEPPKSLLPFYLLAWGFPWVPVSLYSILRAKLDVDQSCWLLQSFGPFEWLIYVPNLLSLAINIIFLINILRILLTQIQAHPNEPSNYRRALKATFVLVPLFGIQLIFIIYRPPSEVSGTLHYAIFESVVTHSQGFFVALVFCFLNGEVLSHLQGALGRFRDPKYSWDAKHSMSASTQLTHTDHVAVTTRSNTPKATTFQNRSYIPMTVITEPNGGAQ